MLDELGREIEAFDLIAGIGVDPVCSGTESNNSDRYGGVCQ
jgi:hypothetical protein